MSGLCYIIGAGPVGGVSPAVLPGDYVIAADGGFCHLARLGMRADLVVGDFDSLGYVPQHPNVRRLPREKDDTDMLFAVKFGLSLGFSRFVLLGGMGGRADHTQANMQTLAFLARRGARGVLLGGGMAVTAIADGEIRFSAGKTGLLSVFCHGATAEGVTVEGAKYPLCGAALTPDLPLGVSNEFLGDPARISVSRGCLLLFWQEEEAVLKEAAHWPLWDNIPP